MLLALIEKLGVLFVDVGGVAEHPVAQIDGGRSGVDRPREAVLDQSGEIAAVVDMSVRKDHRIDGGTGEWQLAVFAIGVFAAPLVEAAIEQIALAAGLHQVHRPGDTAGRPPERDFHYTASAKR